MAVRVGVGVRAIVVAIAAGAAAGASVEDRPGKAAVAAVEPAAEESAQEGATPAALRVIAGHPVPPASKRSISLRVSESFAGNGVELPVLIAHGATAGLTLCLTAGVHGDELNGVEIVRRIHQTLDVNALRGTVVGFPVVNVYGFRSSSRYLPDRRDLNRYFPGHPEGSAASRLAATLFRTLIDACNLLVDFHTGSLHRVNLPQVRGDFADDDVLTLGRSFGRGVLVHNRGMRGTLRRAAVAAGLPAITYEAGEPMRFSEEEIAQGVDGVRNVLAAHGMTGGGQRAESLRIFQRSRWVRTSEAGIFLTPLDVGDAVQQDQVLGTVTDPVSNKRTEIRAPVAGRIIGMAVPQVVIPGFATFHIGVEGDGEPDALSDDDAEGEQLADVEQPE
ncbi:MAG TPA: succinylglutamate desuccinylase/aspartoacylase family protein [Candidatus Limnocylindria bacterium]|nr:succinylglutamate desuccinylase/aspartoacylase family protein [Candidatus Limnocylindria bacterium]